MFQNTRQLKKSQIRDLDELLRRCRTLDKGIPSIYRPLLAQERETENSVLFYHKKKLAGFLGVYFFYQDACEISLLVAPGLRRQGVARRLLQSIYPLLQYKEMEKVIFSCPPGFGETWLSAKGFIWQHSEYHMERTHNETREITDPKLTLRKASMADLSLLCTLDEACFPVENVNMPERFTYLLNHPEYTILLASQNGSIVGKAHIHWQQDHTLFSDIAIDPPHQGKGLGSELLANCINRALLEGKTKLALDVETSNKNALNLYLKHGFETTNVYDYWNIPLERLHTLLKNA